MISDNHNNMYNLNQQKEIYQLQENIGKDKDTQVKDKEEKSQEEDRKQMDNFFQGVETDKKSNTGSHIFKRTYSFYQDQQPPLEPSSQTRKQPLPTQLPNPSVTAQPQQSQNKYKKYIQSATKLLKHLRIAYYTHIFRFFFIIFVYYNLQFIQTYSAVNVNRMNMQANNTYANSTTNGNSTNGETGSDGESGDKKNYFLPWNAMIYILSGSIDFISIIGFISSIRLLKSDMRVLQARQKTQAERILKQKREQQRMKRSNYKKRNSQSALQQHQAQPPLQQFNGPVQNAGVQQNNNEFIVPQNLNIRIGDEKCYSSFFSALRAFKYKNRDQASSFKISKVMHIGATFLFFGRMALQQLYEYQLQSQDPAILVQASLWIFLILAYIGVFQVDLYAIESCQGPRIRIQRFCYRKIQQVYTSFWKWRKCYGIILSIGIVITILWTLFYLIMTIINRNLYGQLPSLLFVMCVLSLVTAMITLYHNQIVVKKSHSYIHTLKSQQNSQKVQPTLSQNTFNQPKPCPPQQPLSIQKMYQHTNFSLLGIHSKYTTQACTYITSINRIVLTLYGLAISRSVGVDLAYENIGGYVASFCFLAIAEIYKFYTLMKFKINLLDSFKYRDNQHCQHNQLNKNQNNQQATSCSVCLLEYANNQDVIILCCGHIFHQVCLIDWLKQKKQCPLCRLNIQEYYEQISF